MSTSTPTSKPSKPSAKFRMCCAISTCGSPLLRARIEALPKKPRKTKPRKLKPNVRRKPKGNVAETVRKALHLYAHMAKTVTVPEQFLPPQDYSKRVQLSAPLKTFAERDRYDAYAFSYGITVSELVLRCLTIYLDKHPTDPLDFKPAPAPTPYPEPTPPLSSPEDQST